MSTFRSRLRTYPLTGIACGVVLCFVAAVPYTLDPRGVYARYGLTYLQVCGIYLVAGGLAGTVAAVLMPLGRTIFGAFFVGTMMGLAVYGTVVVVSPTIMPRAAEFWGALGAGAVVFGPNGVYAWLQEHPRGSGPRWVDAMRAPTWWLVLAWWLAAAIIVPACWWVGTGPWLGQGRSMIPLAVMLVVIGFGLGLTFGAYHEHPPLGPDAPLE